VLSWLTLMEHGKSLAIGCAAQVLGMDVGGRGWGWKVTAMHT
jgi:hypothetical protein